MNICNQELIFRCWAAKNWEHLLSWSLAAYFMEENASNMELMIRESRMNIATSSFAAQQLNINTCLQYWWEISFVAKRSDRFFFEILFLHHKIEQKWIEFQNKTEHTGKSVRWIFRIFEQVQYNNEIVLRKCKHKNINHNKYIQHHTHTFTQIAEFTQRARERESRRVLTAPISIFFQSLYALIHSPSTAE